MHSNHATQTREIDGQTHDHCDDIDELTKRLKDVEVVVFIRERTAIRSALLENLAKLRLISLRGGFPHIDIDSCTKLGIVVSSNLADDLPCHSAADVTWGLVMGALHRIPRQGASVKEGRWQDGVGHSLMGKTLAIYGYGRIGRVVAQCGRAFGMNVVY